MLEGEVANMNMNMNMRDEMETLIRVGGVYWRERREEGREEGRGGLNSGQEEISEGCVSMRIMGVCVQERQRDREREISAALASW